jgi:hypothetical protein
MFGLMCSHREDGGGKRERYTDYVVEASMHVPLRLHNHLGKNKEMALAKTNSLKIEISYSRVTGQ